MGKIGFGGGIWIEGEKEEETKTRITDGSTRRRNKLSNKWNQPCRQIVYKIIILEGSVTFLAWLTFNDKNGVQLPIKNKDS